MLLPSALTCESTSSLSAPKPTSYFPPSSTLFASPPISPPTTTTQLSFQTPASSSNTTISSIYSTCRALQSMLTTPSQLPSPPTQRTQLASSIPIISSPFKLRLRNRGNRSEDQSLTPRKKIGKRAPPRGVNKRRRAIEDEMSRETVDSDCDSEHEHENESEEKENARQTPEREEREGERPRTPKRIRLAPEILPLGLDRSDFHALHLQHQLSSQPLFFPSSQSSHSNAGPFSSNNTQQQEMESEENEEWSTEDDRLLVELVLEKLKLSKSEWQDCARSLGRDRGSVGRRWKSLMAGGDVGLKGRPKAVGGIGGRGKMERGRIYGSWR
ncbi:uncharacterized protein PAC_00725 [Phialocephala subalpina]|uniref:Myb-like domain-containing protein n=1 Tax=Phialocephala subalpina TaxID=576137 RepID=A0A1L7WDJ6_9HELO|nr:uncharacterized protein PAC_00725 [Phialocephala subalpina]